MVARNFLLVILLSSISLLSPKAIAWDWDDTAMESLYMAAHIADWGQTRDIAQQCGEGSYAETNPIIGRCPSIGRVNSYFFATALLHAGVAKMLPKKYRRIFQAGTLGMQIGYISNNASIGLKVNF